jgi:multicomponent Na+:H+ antiporter subunit G
MNWIPEILGAALILIGLAFMLIGSIGILRLPDFFSRTHAASKVDTVGIMIILIGIAVFEGVSITGAKLLLAVMLIVMTHPVSVHVLAQAALSQGNRPWRRGERHDAGHAKDQE